MNCCVDHTVHERGPVLLSQHLFRLHPSQLVPNFNHLSLSASGRTICCSRKNNPSAMDNSSQITNSLVGNKRKLMDHTPNLMDHTPNMMSESKNGRSLESCVVATVGNLARIARTQNWLANLMLNIPTSV